MQRITEEYLISLRIKIGDFIDIGGKYGSRGKFIGFENKIYDPKTKDYFYRDIIVESIEGYINTDGKIVQTSSYNIKFISSINKTKNPKSYKQEMEKLKKEDKVREKEIEDIYEEIFRLNEIIEKKHEMLKEKYNRIRK